MTLEATLDTGNSATLSAHRGKLCVSIEMDAKGSFELTIRKFGTQQPLLVLETREDAIVGLRSPALVDLGALVAAGIEEHK